MRLRTPLTELIGIEHPVVQTGMGWVAGARLVSATSNAGGLGILASATMTIDELATAVAQGQGRHRQAVRRQHPRRRGRRRRPGRPDDPRRRQGRLLRPGAQAGADRPLKEAGVVVIPSVGAAKHAKQGGGLGRRRRDRAGRRGRRAHRPGRHHAAAAVGARRGRHPGDRRGRLLRRTWPGRGAVLRRRRCGDGHPLPADRRTPPCPTRSSSATCRPPWTAPSCRPGWTACRTACCAPAWSRSSKAARGYGVSPPRCATPRSSRRCRR